VIFAVGPPKIPFCRPNEYLVFHSGLRVPRTQKAQAPATLFTEIHGLVPFNPVVAPGRQGVLATSAFIAELAIFPHRYPVKVVLAGGPRIGTEELHYLFPFLAVWPNIAEPVDNISNVVGHFMRHRLCEIVFKVFCKYERVVANHTFSVSDAVHSGSPATKIKLHRYFSETPSKQFRYALDP
jgi:hypothetical protein